MKTISELNQRIWYRLLQVVYALCFSILTIVILSLIYNFKKPHREFDANLSYIQCKNDKKINLTENNIYSDFITKEDDEKIRILCRGDDKSLLDDLLLAGVYPEDYNQQDIEEAKKRVEEREGYTLISNFKQVGSWQYLVLYCAVVILVILSIFELVRRIFYYIVLGRIKPEK